MREIPAYLFLAWSNMFRRCYYVNDPSFPHYGGRGIRVCARWRSIDVFCRDIGQRPTPKHSLDRIDNDGDYRPGNCRWATQREQMRNTRALTLLTHKGRTQSLTEWAEEVGMSRITLRKRLKLGWPLQVALSTPTDRQHARVQQRNARAQCDQAGVPLSTFYYRLSRGMSEQDALKPHHRKP